MRSAFRSRAFSSNSLLSKTPAKDSRSPQKESAAPGSSLPSREFEGVPENEFSMLTLARLVGIDVPPIRLIDVDAIGDLPDGVDALKGQAFAIERFDRLPDGTAVHIEDFAQVFGIYPADKYSKATAMNIATVVGAEGGEADIIEFIRRPLETLRRVLRRRAHAHGRPSPPS
jgi:serine/threonine protein kinase HipA of HipAB toxin-antitoxin module